MGLLEDFNKQMEDAQVALRNAITAHGNALSEAFHLYFDNCQKEQEAFKTKMQYLHAHLHESLHGETGSKPPSIESEIAQQIASHSPSPLISDLTGAVNYLNKKDGEP